MKRILASVAAVILLLLAAPAARAASCTVTTIAAVCVAARSQSPQYRYVVIDNEGAANICVTDDGSTPVCGAAGTYTILPGQSRVWGPAGDGGPHFAGPWTAIAASGSQPVSYTAQ